ncbi:serine hydrolase domain-containing protein [Streptomyces hoynatensis]|uniref:Class A beta-lactamase-related serine hydrolase n=1 Tax=Streptomyces hoynatensis TaxID=1141874 RepID=A0A3A9ZI10_9ACTN|nr:serine hydrolase domain-containing protein [Streptomyces hoynatensis]RKN46906.1 class A beta-lactamase-related serine hydrolase [Streptomyces hoynatensis]
MTNTSVRIRRLRASATAMAAAAVLAGGGSVVPAAAAAAAAPSATAPLTAEQLRQEVERALRDGGFVGLSVEVRDGRHRSRAQAGEAELGTGREVPAGASLRAGSATKPFVATVVLQLAAEGRLSLDDTVEQWLPGVVTGNGNDGSRITIRNLLQQTSGIHNYDYADDVGDDAAAFEEHRFDQVSPWQLVAGAMGSAPDFPPAAPGDPAPDWGYSNPNYILAGLIIQRVTGQDWATAVTERIIEPLGLAGTYAPGDDPSLPEPYLHTYHHFAGAPEWTDTTIRSMSWADAAGALVTTERDLDRFFTALLDGRLLPPRELAEMRDTVPVDPDFEIAFPGLTYGLGLMREPLSCGGHRWGHGGDLAGATVREGVTEDGRRSIVINASGKTEDDEQLLRAEAALRQLMDTVLCRGTR